MSPRDRILARRAKFVAAALAGAGAIGCSSTASVCLEPAFDGGTDTSKPDGSTTDTGTDTGPTACLSPELDTGPLDSGTTDSTLDTGPMPCLSPPEDTG